MSNLAEKLPEELEQQSLTLYEQALSLEITDQPSYAAAGEFGKSLKELEKKITDFFAPLKKAAHEAHKAITKKETDELSPVKEAMTAVRTAMNTYLNEQERLRREKEARLRKIEEERAAKERERLLAQAVKAEEKGKDEKAADLLEQAENVYAAPVTVASSVGTVKTGNATLSGAKELQVSVTDLKAFLAALVKGNYAPTMINVQPAPLKSWVKANGFESFPGLHIEKVMSARIR